MVKGGSTSLGQKASHSHTGTLSESTKLIKAIMKQANVIQANSFHELFQYARTFSMMYNTNKILPIKGNATMVAGSGGAGTITADLTNKHGWIIPNILPIAPWSAIIGNGFSVFSLIHSAHLI